MEKIRNKFIILVFVLIGLIVFVGIYKSFFANSIDRNTYAILIEGKGSINEEMMIKDLKEELEVGDVVKSVGENSLVVIEWGDGSVTRLGEDSSIQVNELYVDKDLLQINLSFELLSGKSWSNVINFMGSKSYFKESFRDIEAGVRGTVFNVDLDNEYISVIKHKITLIGDGLKETTINESEPFSLKTLTFIKIVEFIKNIKDSDFEQLNVKFDKDLLEGLKNKIHENLDGFADLASEQFEALSDENREKLYNTLLSKYQELNFVDSGDEELFAKKIEYKEALISLAGDDEKVNLIENIIYDFKDSIKSKNYGNLDSILPILNENKEIIDNINVDFGEYFKNIKINDSLNEAFGRNLDYLKNIFGSDFSTKFPDISFDGIKQQAEELYNNSNAKETINDQVGFIKKFLQLLFNK